MALFRSILFAIIFYAGTFVAVTSAFAVAALRGPPALRRHAVGWARFHRWCTRVLLGINPRVEGVMPAGPVLYAAKHQSMYETLELLAMLPGEPAVVVKRELAQITGWGKIARMYGVIPVDREGSSAALREMLKAARAAVADGRPVLIFPEGTRVPPGTQPPLRAGFAGLYKMLGLPVVPIALDSGRVYPRGGFIRRPGVVTFRFAEPLPPGLSRDAIEAAVHDRINELDR